MNDTAKPDGWLPPEQYYQRLQESPTCFRELIDFYETDGQRFILLEQRPEDDPFYAGRYATMGSTIMMRESFGEFAERHAGRETGIITTPAPEWIFCGLMSTPHTKRHHGSIEIFARVWNSKPHESNGQWYELSHLHSFPLVPSIKVTIDLAVQVCFRGQAPKFVEFLGTDE